jgi:hypothetical protein
LVVDFRMGDVLRLRKPHPCGGFEWEVVRLGADIGLRCLTCGRRLLLERTVLEKRLKAFLSRGAEAPGDAQPSPSRAPAGRNQAEADLPPSEPRR